MGRRSAAVVVTLEDADTWGQYLGYLRVGDGKHRAARKVGMSARSVGAWLGKEGNEGRRIEAADAEEEALELVEEALWQAAVTGEPWAVQRWLKFRAPDRWGDRASGMGALGSGGVVSPADISRMALELAAAAGVAVGRVAQAAETLAGNVEAVTVTGNLVPDPEKLRAINTGSHTVEVPYIDPLAGEGTGKHT